MPALARGPRIGHPALAPSSEPEHDTCRVAKAVLAITEAAGKSGRERVGRAKLCAEVIHLDSADGDMPAHTDIDTTTERHGKSIGAG